MSKIKTFFGLSMMVCAMLISEKPLVFVTYVTAAITHELGHLIIAKLLNIKVKEICFDFSGVRICVDEDLTPYSYEFALACAGPCMNILLAGCVLGGVCRFVSESELICATEKFLELGEPDIIGLCGFFVLSSLIQASINLLPIKTFDGGRMLYCLIARMSDSRKADKLIGVTSVCFAFVIWAIAIYLMLRMSVGLGIYVFSVSVFAITLNDTQYVDKTK